MSGRIAELAMKRLDDRRPLPPACSCGAMPTQRRSCPLAVSAGRDVDIENCPTWQAVATRAGWLADAGDAP